MAKPKGKPISEKDRYIEAAKRDADTLLEIAQHINTLASHGFYCQVAFDNIRNLYGAPPTCGAVVAELSHSAKAKTLLMLNPPADIKAVLDGLRTLTGKSGIQEEPPEVK